MKRLCLLLAALMACYVNEAFAETNAAKAAETETPWAHVIVFTGDPSGKLDQDGYFSYGIPAIETAADGTLLAFADAAKYFHEPPYDPKTVDIENDLVLKRSTDGGRTWSKLEIVDHAGQFWQSTCPVPVLDRQTSRVWLHYVRLKPHVGQGDLARPGTDDVQNMVRYSDDHGKTWSEPTDITVTCRDMTDTNWHCTVIGPGSAGIQDRKGRLIMAAWKGYWGNFAVFSEDHGRTWQRGQMVPGSSDKKGNEAQLVELADGRILMDFRQGEGSDRWLATSSDGGLTWSPPRPGQHVTPICSAIKRYTLSSAGDDRNRILWTGPASPDKRITLVVRISYDEAESFVAERLIADGLVGYSSLAILKDKSAGVLWERMYKDQWTRQSIFFTRLDRLYAHYYVAKNGAAVPPYTNWANAATNIQDAINQASAAYDTVWISNGTYVLTGQVSIAKSLNIYGYPKSSMPVISGNNSNRCILVSEGTVVLSNLYITRGYATNNGGGIAGGILYNCTVASNYSAGAGGGACGSILYNCTVAGNHSAGDGGGACGTLSNCTVTGNYSARNGGGAAGILYNCIIMGNSASNWAGGVNGSRLYNCLVVSNSSAMGGGAFACNLYNCTVAGNTGYGVAVACNCINCIIYNNAPGNYDGWIANIFTNCCTTPAQAEWANGNITNNPSFVNPNAGNYRLSQGSPCINAGANACVTTNMPTDLDGHRRIDHDGGTVDMGCYEYPFSNTMVTILRSGK